MTDVSEQSVADVLNRAADLIEPEGAWTQGVTARNAKGEIVSWRVPEAICWCAVSSISKAAGDNHGIAASARMAMRKVVPTGYISDWNDHPRRTQAEVVAALRSVALLAAPRAGEGG